MRVLVTGGAEYLGSILAKKFVKKMKFNIFALHSVEMAQIYWIKSMLIFLR